MASLSRAMTELPLLKVSVLTHSSFQLKAPPRMAVTVYSSPLYITVAGMEMLPSPI